jgi:hypothetical protein
MIRPKVAPATSMRGITTGAGTPVLRSFAASIPVKAITAPTERSIPPVRMTKVIPAASTIR